MDPSPRDRNQGTCAKSRLSDGDQRLTYRSMGASNSHRMRNSELPQDLHRTAGGRKITNHDRRAIVALSLCDRGSVVAKLGAMIASK